jgi:uncharacterized membrane protein YkvA (DUF1232 family)
MFKTILLASSWFRNELSIYKKVVMDKRTPYAAKICYILIIVYAIMPFDFILDMIPIFGLVDDFILIPTLFVIARYLTPKSIIEEKRQEVLGPHVIS